MTLALERIKNLAGIATESFAPVSESRVGPELDIVRPRLPLPIRK